MTPRLADALRIRPSLWDAGWGCRIARTGESRHGKPQPRGLQNKREVSNSPAVCRPDICGFGTLTVDDNLIVENGGILGLGCSPAAGCKGTSSDSVGGNVTVIGGGGGLDCSSGALFGGPPFTTFEDNTIGGSVNWAHMSRCWGGLLRNQVHGSVGFNDNHTSDPDGNEVQTNVIGGNLACYNNTPAPQQGDSQGQPNVVGGSKLGQCKAL